MVALFYFLQAETVHKLLHKQTNKKSEDDKVHLHYCLDHKEYQLGKAASVTSALGSIY